MPAQKKSVKAHRRPHARHSFRVFNELQMDNASYLRCEF